MRRGSFTLELRRPSGQQVVRILKELGFSVRSQQGSHAKLRPVEPGDEKRTVTIPAHGVLEKAPYAIIRQASRYIPESELRNRFYTN